MARRDNAYSRAVAGAKIVLPLIAIGLLGLLFFLGEPAPDGTPLRMADKDLRELTGGQQLGKADYATVTSDGTEVRISARRFYPGDGDASGITLGDDLSARLQTPDGLSYEVAAPAGRHDSETGATTLTGGVRIDTSDGYRLRTDTLAVRADPMLIETLTPVRGQGPLGTLTAGRMRLVQSETGASTRLVFTGGVRLVYMPHTNTGPRP